MAVFAKFEMKDDLLSQMKLEYYKAAYPKALKGALFEMGLKILNAAKNRAPYRDGELVRSGQVEPPKDGAAGPEVILAFLAEHALPQHEKTEWSHKQGEAKYLEKALKDASSNYLNELAELTKANVESKDLRVPGSPKGKGSEGD